MPQRGLPSCCNGPNIGQFAGRIGTSTYIWHLRTRWPIHRHFPTFRSPSHALPVPAPTLKGILFSIHTANFFRPTPLSTPSPPALVHTLAGHAIPGTLTLLPFAFAGPAQRCGALHCTDASLTLPCGLVILCHFWLLLCSACAVPHVTYRVVYGAVNWAGMTAPLLSSPVLSVPWLVRPPCSSVLSLPAHYPLPCTLRYAVLGTGLTDSDYSDALLLTTYLRTYYPCQQWAGFFVGQSLG